ncbi:MAG: hypothetical protein IJU36_06630 [Paludibacteraceae bacterium]|nr:hypothetical protein [Paludibacteraceae bacterium]
MKKIYTQPRIETVANTPQQMLCASGGVRAKISGYSASTNYGFSQSVPVIIGVICSSLLMLGTACSTTNNPDQPKQQAELKPRTLIVKTSPQPSPQERGILRLPQATITENEGVLDALWNAGDEVFYRNLSYSNDYYDDDEDESHSLSGTLYADKDASIASFTGEQVWCAEENQLALIYPKIDKSAIDLSLVESQLTASYTISVAGQDGSLATLANKYHHIYGIASVVSVTGTTANAELAEMKSLLTVCKFSFVDESDNQLPICTLEIKKGGTGSPYIGTYPQEGTVSIAQNVSAWDVSVGPEWKEPSAGGTPLTIDTKGVNPTEVYVALFPDMGATYSFTVTNSNGTYTGEATATLNEGEFVPATIGLRLVQP